MTLRCLCSYFALLGLAAPSWSAELAPNDPGIADDLVLWLRDSDSDYDPGGGHWADSSGKGHHAVVVGDVGGVIYSPPTLSLIDGGPLSPLQLDGVRFSGNTNDLLATGPLNNGEGLAELTIIAVYAASDRANLTRPIGFGSIAGTQTNPGNHFNLASDPSIRKDNGSVTGHSEDIPLDVPFIRSSRMDANGVDEWFNTDGTPTAVLTNGGNGHTTSTDRFYLGDLRCGSTAVPGFGAATSTAACDLIEVLVYRAALTDQQIADLNEWLTANLGGAPPPTITTFTADPQSIASGESSTLSWEVERADRVTITPTIGAVAISGNSSLSPATTTTYTLTATGEGGETRAQVTVGINLPPGEPFISEFLARNDNILDDEDGDGSDWIELHNPNPFPLDLGGYYLTEDPSSLTKWRIPNGTTVGGGSNLLIFASGKDRTAAGSPLHTNFNLNGSGEFLALVAPNGTTLISQFAPAYPAQYSDVSYGFDDSGTTRYLATPTPEGPNGSGFDGKVADTKFSINRGFYDVTQSVALTTTTDDAEIRYTTDGSNPTATHGSIYDGPIPITTTTVVRAAAFKAGLIPTDVDTHSYLFLNNVIRQSANPAGFPSTWGTRAVDYGMDPRVVRDAAYRDEIIGGLRSIRTLSIVVPQDEFFNNPRGIYANPRSEGRAWEREVSFEFLHPDDATRDKQANCGIRIHGNGSRSPTGQPKHSFRVEFRGEYGPKRLKYQLFPNTTVEEFDSIILRGQNAHGWTRSSQIGNNVGTSEREQSQYIRDSFARDIMKAMGQTSGEATYVHLYINGLYWGLYNPVEYPRAYYGVSHFGGVEEDYDSINRRTTTTKILDGTFDAWNAMQDLADSGLRTRARFEEMETHVNISNLIDYMLMHQYMGSRDGPEVFHSNNMRSIRKSRGPNLVTWIGMPWDMEASMFEIDVTRNVNVDDPNTLVRVYTKLRENPEFRLRYSDHVHRHCFNGGALTPARTAAIWEARATEIYSAIIGESARWGDYRRRSEPFTRDVEWQQERDRLLTTYFPTRTDFLVDLLKQNDLYPDLDAPVFNEHGGILPTGFELIISAAAGTIYHTNDGSDPREAWTETALGTVYNDPLTLNQSQTIKARTFLNGEWSALTEASFYVGNLAARENLAVTELMYNPLGTSETLEFVEMVNTSASPIDLSGVHFGAGLDFGFPVGTIVGAGGYILVVHDRTAFEAEYGGDLTIAGEFRNGTALENAGELITLLAADDSEIESFHYQDTLPWPISPDGLGPSLTRVQASLPNDPNDPQNWRPSASAGGSPGTGDATIFTGDPNADSNHNGLTDFVEYAIGDALTIGSLTLDGVAFPTLSITRHVAADDVRVTPETSADLITWTGGVDAVVLANTFHHADGTTTTTWRSSRPFAPDQPREFLRFRIESLLNP